VSVTKIPCYSVKVEIPNQLGGSDITYYLVRTDSEALAISAVQKILPELWKAVKANQTALRKETAEALDLRPGIPRPM
jgi:hypothetical protein